MHTMATPLLCLGLFWEQLWNLFSLPTGSKLEALYCLCLCVMLQLKQMAPILLHPHHGQELLMALNVCASLLILQLSFLSHPPRMFLPALSLLLALCRIRPHAAEALCKRDLLLPCPGLHGEWELHFQLFGCALRSSSSFPQVRQLHPLVADPHLLEVPWIQCLCH